MPEPVQDQVFSGPNVAVHKVEKAAVNDTAAASNNKQSNGDLDAQTMLIGSLRSQIQDLFSQVTQLNNKLVQSYDRVSDLEDSLHMASANVRQSSVKISHLELERTQHLAALNTGLLVEKSHVTAELTRLMEKATEEAAQRGQAETARADIEKDLDDLSATLFDQANTMVAEARFARAQSERKVEDAEQALKGAEEAVAIMQQQMQDMQGQKEKATEEMEEMRTLMGKGKWIEKVNDAPSPLLRLRSSHTPYQEFLLFVAHLRNIRPSSTSPPAMSTLLPLPFLARILSEDCEPTVRLDIAPSLNWLSRRSVLSAIYAGQLIIEPIPSTNLLQESVSAQTSNANVSICCALCGMSIFHNDRSPHSHSRPSPHPISRTSSSINSISRSANLLFKNTRSYSATNSTNSAPPSSPRRSVHGSLVPYPQQIYIFRLASTGSPTSNLGVAMLPVSIAASYSFSSTSMSSQSPHHPSQLSTPPQARNVQSTIYPLCTSGWCLTRLRSTCSLWAFIRTGIVEKVWEEEVPVLSTFSPSKPPVDKSSGAASAGLGKPPVPPRRRGLWGMASVLGERAASWSENDKGRARTPDKTPDKEVDKRLLPPPPAHPLSAAASSRKSMQLSPPPLPLRAGGRGKTRSATVSRAATPSPSPDVDDEELTPIINGHMLLDDAGQPNNENEQLEDVKSESIESTVSNVTEKAQETMSESAALSFPSDEAPLTSAGNENGPDADLPSPLSSPSTDRRHSQDSFTSAASDITPPETSALPGPINTTPQDAPASSSNSSLQPPSTPTQTHADLFNAAPSAPVLHTAASNEAPSLSKTSVPPPLPRRAAARARPSSIVPSVSPTTFVSENATDSASNNATDASDTLAVLNGEATIKETAADPPADSAELLKETAESVSESVQAPTEHETEVKNEAVEEPHHAINGNDGTEAERPLTPSSTDHKGSEVPSSPTDTIIGAHVNGINAVSVQSDEGTDSEVYVGDATWEERTWKELVKLKENVFWARIGGLR